MEADMDANTRKTLLIDEIKALRFQIHKERGTPESLLSDDSDLNGKDEEYLEAIVERLRFLIRSPVRR
jgi:hypothetical protein